MSLPHGLNALGLAGIVLVVLMVVAALVLVVVLVRKYFALRRCQNATAAKVTFWFSLLYTVCPIDLLPDPIYIDDIGVLVGTLVYVNKVIRRNRPALTRPSEN